MNFIKNVADLLLKAIASISVIVLTIYIYNQMI